MDQFTERLARLAELADEELASLEEELVVAFDAADEAADLDGMQSIADAIDTVRAEKEARNPVEEVPAEEVPAEAVVEEVPAQMAASATDEVSETEEPAPDDSEPAVEADANTEETKTVDETPTEDAQPEEVVADAGEGSAAGEAPEVEAEAPAEVAAETETAPEAEAPAEAEVEAEVAAEDAPAEAVEEIAESVTPSTAEAPEAEAIPEATEVAEESEEQVAEEITADDVPEANQPVAAAAPTYTIRAGGDIPGITAGSTLEGMDDVVEAMTKKVNAMRGVGGDGEHIVVASFQFDEAASDERTLKPGDLNGNAKKIRDFLADPEGLTREALVAGAWCAPRTPIYDVPTVGTTARPVRDALPSFNAERGGITWIAPPGLPVEATSLWRYDSADSTWKSYEDPRGLTETDPAETKPCITIPCGPEQNADVDAIPTCFCFDNLSARAFPEWVRANTELVLIGQARFAEQFLLSKMYAVAATGNSCGTPAIQLGAARDFVLTIQTAAAAQRWRLRLDKNAPLQLLAPAWVQAAIAVDLGLQHPGDDTFTVGSDDVDGYFREFNVDPIWHIDDIPGGAGAFTGCAFPDAADWLLFPTGSFLRLDTGELNLGVVRTKEDVQKNKYCEFSETFETVSYTGPLAPNGWITRGTTSIDLLGSYGAPRELFS